MTLEDPFYVVKDEVFKALNKTRGLYLRWQELAQSGAPPHSPEAEWTSTELRNALRSIEWDLEDLEDTISIVEKNSSKFKIDNKEISERKKFIDNTRKEVTMMRGRVSRGAGGGSVGGEGGAASEPLLAREGSDSDSTPLMTPWERAYRPANSRDPYTHTPLVGVGGAQNRMLGAQEAQLEALAASTGSLKHVSLQIGAELDDQSVLIDELNTELQNTGSRLDSTVTKVARVLRLNNDGRQWCVIGLLVLLLVLVIIFFIIF